MNVDAALRAAAVAAAVLILVAPKWGQVASAAVRIAQAARDAAKAHGKTVGRVAAAGLIVAAAWGKVPVPSFTVPTAVPAVEVETPSDAMQRVVTPIAAALKSAPMSDRMLWAQLWNKAAIVVAGDAISTEVVFTDTRSLRLFTVLALDLGWRRIGGNQPGEYKGLREATEAAFAEVLGTAEVPVTKDLRARYAELAKAIAWAGINGG